MKRLIRRALLRAVRLVVGAHARWDGCAPVGARRIYFANHSSHLDSLVILAALPRGALVTDIVYAPLVTPLLAAARDCGNPIVDGLGMLLHQARPGFEAWFELRPEVTPDLHAFVLSA